MARTVVYDPGGAPAYMGQAMMIRSCAGGGAFCHVSGTSHRYGVPFDLDFDPILADDPRYPDEPTGAAHLWEAQVRIHHFRNDIYSTVYGGSMPPGQLGADTTGPQYTQYASASDTVGAPMPGLDTNEGLEMLRVWLACGSPLVEATSALAPRGCNANADCAPLALCDFATSQCIPVGAVIARRAGTTTATWSSIYATILAPSCASEVCHGASGAVLSGNLDLSSADTAFAALVNTSSDLSGCGTRVVPGNPTSSLLLTKLEGTQPVTCGDPMPIGTMLPADQIAAVRTWITNGAPND